MIADRSLKNFAIISALTGLLLVYLFQRFDYLGAVANWLGQPAPSAGMSFVINRTTRLFINDLFCLVLIAALFDESKYARLAFWIFVAELFVLLPVYLVIKLSLEGPTELSSPMLQPLHRMIINPLLMVILIAGSYYQRWKESLS